MVTIFVSHQKSCSTTITGSLSNLDTILKWKSWYYTGMITPWRQSTSTLWPKQLFHLYSYMTSLPILSHMHYPAILNISKLAERIKWSRVLQWNQEYTIAAISGLELPNPHFPALTDLKIVYLSNRSNDQIGGFSSPISIALNMLWEVYFFSKSFSLIMCPKNFSCHFPILSKSSFLSGYLIAHYPNSYNSQYPFVQQYFCYLQFSLHLIAQHSLPWIDIILFLIKFPVS